MRTSCYPDDPGHDTWLRLINQGAEIKIFLDGVELRHCTMADTDKGYVEVFKLNDSNELYVKPDTGAIAFEKKYGEVIIEVTKKPGMRCGCGAPAVYCLTVSAFRLDGVQMVRSRPNIPLCEDCNELYFTDCDKPLIDLVKRCPECASTDTLDHFDLGKNNLTRVCNGCGHRWSD